MIFDFKWAKDANDIRKGAWAITINLPIILTCEMIRANPVISKVLILGNMQLKVPSTYTVYTSLVNYSIGYES
jgi:hypothetical protein